jgi:ketosteroid isomerase-like protein
MKAPTILCSSILIILALTGCNQLSSHDAAVKAIQDTEAQWNQDYASRDVDKIMDHYADDAVLMVPGTPISNGKAAIREGTKPMAADPAMALKFASINDHGSYVTTFRKQPDGSWKVVADIATSEVPPSAPTPAPPTP